MTENKSGGSNTSPQPLRGDGTPYSDDDLLRLRASCALLIQWMFDNMETLQTALPAATDTRQE